MEIKYCRISAMLKGKVFKGRLNGLSPLLMKCSLKILCAQWEGILHAEKIATPSMVPMIRLQSAGHILFKHPGGH